MTIKKAYIQIAGMEVMFRHFPNQCDERHRSMMMDARHVILKHNLKKKHGNTIRLQQEVQQEEA